MFQRASVSSREQLPEVPDPQLSGAAGPVWPRHLLHWSQWRAPHCGLLQGEIAEVTIILIYIFYLKLDTFRENWTEIVLDRHDDN